ncbi:MULTISPECIES: MBL fold metallo-hydrolase [unclassified Streptomyces]|uniref:MBL fold metallo-hydrolase n=1 Tax=unclassified Streptomyces TaxID=2593676 RepID=UPI000ADFC4D1|nr:MBL fold metallo-hydrolase [Streptomyces sp. NBC_00370]
MSKSMRSRLALMTTALVLVGGSVAAAPVFAQGQGHSQASHRDFAAEILAAQTAAKNAAGLEHLGTLNRLCFLPPVNGAPSTTDTTPAYIDDPSKAPAKSTWYADSARAFDDLYFVGGSVHSAWILKTSAGLILIDSGYQYSAQTLIIDGMKKFGLDPKDIKYIIISHAHADHVGGVEVVQKATKNARVVMGSPDWDAIKAHPKTFKGQTPDFKTGIRVSKNTDLKLGGTTVHIIPTPGHTPGTLSMTFTVHDYGDPVTVAYSGGTALGFQNDKPDPGIANLQQYIDSAKKMQAAAVKAGATVIMSNHSEFDNAATKTKELAGRGAGPNPFVNGAASVKNYFDVSIQCAKADQLGLEADAAGK